MMSIKLRATPIVRAALGSWLLLAWTRGAEVLDLPPAADTTLVEAAPTNNLGAQPFFNSGTTGPNAGLMRNRALIRFEPAAWLPAGSRVLSAQLIVEVVGEPDQDSAASTFALHRLLRPWGEGDKSALVSPGLGAPATAGEATWLHRRAGTTEAWGQPGGEAGTDYDPAPSSSRLVYGLDDSPYDFGSTARMTADVQSWLDDPGTNHGWIFLTSAEGTAKTARRFGSRESAGDAPRLRIGFVAPPRIDRAARGGGGMELEFRALAGLTYRVEDADDPAGAGSWGLWAVVGPLAVDTTVVVRDDRANPRRYYRLAIE